MSKGPVFLVLVLALSLGSEAPAGEIDLRGQAAVSLVANDLEPRELHADLRYQPDLTVGLPLGDYSALTGFASVEALYRSVIRSLDEAEGEGDLTMYRLWLRYAIDQAEVRAGRQKISFGSATLLRPLMWFDSIDPRDPLQITEGVDGLLVRTYFANNGNLWLWGLWGNDEPKGWEQLPTVEDEVEYGGRVQWPLGNGEIAATYHHRLADLGALVAPLAGTSESEVLENRFALDGKWDLTVGLWFEAVLVHQDNQLLMQPYGRFATAGVDYTFGIGQGLTVLFEHMIAGRSTEAIGSGGADDYSACSLRFPWGVVDEFGLIANYDWDGELFYSYLEWRRTYDRWSFHLMGFVNPAEAGDTAPMQQNSLLAGTGGRFLVAFNH